MADLAWTVGTILLVILSLVVVAVGFPGAIGKRVRSGVFRRTPAKRDAGPRAP